MLLLAFIALAGCMLSTNPPKELNKSKLSGTVYASRVFKVDASVSLERHPGEREYWEYPAGVHMQLGNDHEAANDPELRSRLRSP